MARSACVGKNAVELDVVAGNPSAVEPEDIEFAIITSKEFAELSGGEILIVFPPVGVTLLLIVDAAVGGGEIRIPEPLAVPVGL